MLHMPNACCVLTTALLDAAVSAAPTSAKYAMPRTTLLVCSENQIAPMLHELDMLPNTHLRCAIWCDVAAAVADGIPDMDVLIVSYEDIEHNRHHIRNYVETVFFGRIILDDSHQLERTMPTCDAIGTMLGRVDSWSRVCVSSSMLDKCNLFQQQMMFLSKARAPPHLQATYFLYTLLYSTSACLSVVPSAITRHSISISLWPQELQAYHTFAACLRTQYPYGVPNTQLPSSIARVAKDLHRTYAFLAGDARALIHLKPTLSEATGKSYTDDGLLDASSNESANCCICLELKDELCVMLCNHFVCSQCAEGLVRARGSLALSCPMCRMQFSQADFRRVARLPTPAVPMQPMECKLRALVKLLMFEKYLNNILGILRPLHERRIAVLATDDVDATRITAFLATQIIVLKVQCLQSITPWQDRQSMIDSAWSTTSPLLQQTVFVASEFILDSHDLGRCEIVISLQPLAANTLGSKNTMNVGRDQDLHVLEMLANKTCEQNMLVSQRYDFLPCTLLEHVMTHGAS